MNILQEAIAQNVEVMATKDEKFYSRPCSWRCGKDGLREVAYNYVQEVKTPIQISGRTAGTDKQMVAYSTLDKKVVLSKHIDDKSAMLACELYNKHLGLTK
jgi:hypothetical protein